MKLRLIYYDENGEHDEIKECVTFEFRSNNVTNWIKLYYEDGSKEYIHRLVVVKHIEENYDV